MPDNFKPILYLKNGCPFCFKLRVFLLDAGLLDRFVLREFSEGSNDEKAIRDELSPYFDKVSFPSAQVTSGTSKEGFRRADRPFREGDGCRPGEARHLPSLCRRAVRADHVALQREQEAQAGGLIPGDHGTSARLVSFFQAARTASILRVSE